MRNKKIDLKSYLPMYVKDEELSLFVDVFESVLNEFFDVSENKFQDVIVDGNTQKVQVLPFEVEYDNKIKSIPMAEATKKTTKSPIKYKYGYSQPGVQSTDDRPISPNEITWDYSDTFPTDKQLEPVYPWVSSENSNNGEYLNSTPPQHGNVVIGYPNEYSNNNQNFIPHPFDSRDPVNVNNQGYESFATNTQKVGLYDPYNLPEKEQNIPQFTNYFTSGYEKVEPVMSISIFEKINRLLELKDPSLIDFEYIQYFAEHMGWNLNIGYDSVYKTSTNNLFSNKFGKLFKDQKEINEMIEKQVRSFMEHLPYWYRIKTTESALQVILFSFGLVSDVIKWYTEDYSSDRHKWDSAEAFYNTANYRTASNQRNEIGESFESLGDDWFPTPHFTVRYDVNESFTLYTGVFKDPELFGRLVDTIMAIKPITTVFNGITARLKTNSSYISTIYSVSTTFTYSRTTTGYKDRNDKWIEVPISNIE